jgi:hypothetical protein
MLPINRKQEGGIFCLQYFLIFNKQYSMLKLSPQIICSAYLEY